jgi:hypothetical protein
MITNVLSKDSKMDPKYYPCVALRNMPKLDSVAY